MFTKAKARGALRVKGNKPYWFPLNQSYSVLLYFPTRNSNKLRTNYMPEAGRHSNFLLFQGARPDHVQVDSASSSCFPRELVSFGHPRENVFELGGLNNLIYFYFKKRHYESMHHLKEGHDNVHVPRTNRVQVQPYCKLRTEYNFSPLIYGPSERLTCHKSKGNRGSVAYSTDREN